MLSSFILYIIMGCNKAIRCLLYMHYNAYLKRTVQSFYNYVLRFYQSYFALNMEVFLVSLGYIVCVIAGVATTEK